NLDKGNLGDRTGVEIDIVQSFEILRRAPVKEFRRWTQRRTVFVSGLEESLIKTRRVARDRNFEPDVLRAGDRGVDIRPVGICYDRAVRLAIVGENDPRGSTSHGSGPAMDEHSVVI